MNKQTILKAGKLFFILMIVLASNHKSFSQVRQEVSLNGTWEFAVGEAREGAETAVGAQDLPWRQVTLPGPLKFANQEAANQTKSQEAGLAILRDFVVFPADRPHHC